MSERSRSRRHASRAARHRTLIAKRAAMIGAILIIVLMIAAVLWFNSNADSPPTGVNATKANVMEISVDEAYQLYQQGAFILDVRQVDEWDAFHIPGATLIPLDQLAARVDEVPRDRQVVVVCHSGNRSRTGGNILLAAGFTNVTSMSGGVTAWSNAGYPIEGTRP